MNSWVLVVTSIVTTLAVVVYTIFACLQWREIKKQATSASKQVGKTGQQLEVMGKESDAMQGQLAVMSESLTKTQRIIEQNEQSISIAQKNMVYALRAYVSIPSGSVEFAGDDARFLLTIENSGNTPANNVLINAVIEVARPPVNLDRDTGELIWRSVGTIGPGHAPIHKSDFLKIAPTDRVLVETEKLGLYCRGTITYDDVFAEKKRTTIFCFVYRPGGITLGPCAGGNKAD